jgi:putative nucleotidyltransferase with HDIG domain
MRGYMNSRNETSARLLPKKAQADDDRDGAAAPRRRPHLLNSALAVATAIVLSFVLLPRVPLLKQGDIASRDITVPYTMYVEYPASDQTLLFARVQRGEVIVAAGHRVTEKAEAVLAEMARREGMGSRLGAFAGLTLLVLLVFYLFYRDVRRYRPALLSDTRKMVLLVVLLLQTVIVSRLLQAVLSLMEGTSPLHASTIGFVLPAASGAMLVSLLLDFHLALAFSFIVSLFLGMAFPGDPFLPLYYFVGSIVSALYVIRCKKRTVIIRAAAMTAIMNAAAIISIDLYQGELVSRGLVDLGAGLLSAVITASIASVAVPFFEAFFDIATDIKLLELLDPNQPLLKELVYKTPGTYHHSILIGNLAEAGAEAIGENPLLARVGSSYHDIGKIQKPEYFIENQRTDENKHDRLSPSMSSLIITSHVREGVELARQYRLPSTVVDIVRQHHGNSLITYFYQKAKELQPGAVIEDQDFRYPGPRPRTKVAAIVMLADAVEAASRTLQNPTPQQIQNVVNNVITRIFLDDQLSMCDLTLKDLREIAKSFTNTLGGIYHHRIDYPGVEFPGAKKRSDHPDKKHPEEARADGAVRSGTC